MRHVLNLLVLVAGLTLIRPDQAAAQLTLELALKWNGQRVDLRKGPMAGRQQITLTKLRFYISHIELTKKGLTVWREPGSYHLVDAAGYYPKFPLEVPKQLEYDGLALNLGIDSATNAAGVQVGDLDPIEGMYWAWHSGYINLKLEGTAPQCSTRNHAFQYHLGGFRPGELCVQRLAFAIPQKPLITLQVEVARLLEAINLGQMPTVMTPGPTAVELSRKAAAMFSIVPSP